MNEQAKGRNRVWGSRWLAGFATALLLVGVVAASGLVFGGPRAAEAAAPIARIEVRLTIPGVTDTGRETWIEVDSFQWGVGRGASTPVAGPVKAEPLTIVKELDKTSPTFAQFCCNGQHIPEVTIELCRASCDKAKYLEIRMENVLISGYSVSSGGDRPMESISLNFAKMTIDYFDQDAKDNPKTGTVAWDCPSWPDCTCRS